MVLPQFSLRMALGLVAVLGFVSLLVSRGLQGSAWAMGISVALGALVFSFVVFAAVFGLVFVASKVIGGRAIPRRVIPVRASVAQGASPGLPRDNSNLAPPAGESL